ncbi:hypothetical protein HNP84_005858 [Thermocatellispora tengchongensis]|uniref:Uncharacterized protein n=1 Tax=Thermocatellispora tengchongensis TaxID=1073253 RepID=A0A840P494_9ACTN|nr:hypothetical protein [Thermocatellispora tengchongensis]MBB5136114.1 hypothetical protein [Thermocatellispora tengchongensis]
MTAISAAFLHPDNLPRLGIPPSHITYPPPASAPPRPPGYVNCRPPIPAPWR